MQFRKEDPARLLFLRTHSDAFSMETFDPDHLGIPVMHPYPGDTRIPCPADVPHPRVLLRRDMLPGILKAMDDPEAAEAARVFREMIETKESGVLPPATERERGFYTLNNRKLVILQAKALAYLLSGNREYGLEALNGIRNYLATMTIRWLKNDICRLFGYAMYVAACIYDWCYDLTDEAMRAQIICGVGYGMCIGETEGILKAGATERIDKVKMEMGFPPEKQGPMTGHGTELQLLRDYLSFAMAIYEEEPSWWQFVGKRFFTEYPPARNVYYEAGIYPQGTNYAPFRMQADAWACWLIKNAFDLMPFHAADMRRTVYTLVNFEIGDKKCMRTGDDGSENGCFFEYDSYTTLTLIASYLFRDAGLMAWARYFGDGYTSFADDDPHFHGRPNRITPAEFLIIAAGGVAPAADRHLDMPLVNHNGGFSGTVIARTGYGEQHPMCMLRGLCRTTANHDHQEAGTFQLAYKGLVTGDSGVYETYGSPQHLYYHQATLAHNGLLVFNPALSDLMCDEAGRPLDPAAFYYSGGQRYMRESGALSRWQQPDYDMARELCCAVKWRRTVRGPVPEAVSYAVDMTDAYPAGTVRSIRRFMTVVFPDVPGIGMVLTVMDDICPADPSFRCTFLLQCPTEPAVKDHILTFAQGGGQLTLFSLAGCDGIETYGLPDRQFFNARDGKGPGVNIACIVPGKGSDIWGHAELSRNMPEEHTRMLHVIVVSDADSSVPFGAELLQGNGYTAARIRTGGKTFAVAFTSQTTFSFQPDEDCYVTDEGGSCSFHSGKRDSLPDDEFIKI